MQLQSFSRYAIPVLSLCFLASCKVDIPKEVVVVGVEKQPASSVKSTCTASVNPATVKSGVPVAVTIHASNNAPFSGAGTGSFNESTTVARTYDNSTTSQITLNDELIILNSNGDPVSCTWTVNVLPEWNTPALSCTITPTLSQVKIGQPVGFVVKSGDNTEPFTLVSISAGDGAVAVNPFIRSSDTQGSATYWYSTSGKKTISAVIKVKESSAYCQNFINVIPAPSVTAKVNPFGVIPANVDAELTVTHSNFTSAPTFSYSTVQPNVTITPNGNTAKVRVTNGVAASFDVVVIAKTDSEQAATTVRLEFGSPVYSSPLNCTITAPSGSYKIDDVVSFSVDATDSSEKLQLTYVSLPSGATAVGSLATSPFYVKFSSAGRKTISVLAQGSTSGRLCNGGAFMHVTTFVTGRLTSCSLVSKLNPANMGQSFTVVAIPNYNSGTVGIEGIYSTPAAYGNYTVLSDKLSASLQIYNSGTFNLSTTLRDASTNEVVSCSFQQIVW